MRVLAHGAKSFEAQYERLNPEQREGVDALHGPVMVIAGPGTGKTEMLTMRIANLFHHEVVPERILALTFTEAGATNVRKRLAELVGPDAYRAEISTFHGFANRIIHEHPDHFPELMGASNIAEIEQVRIMRALLDTLPLTALRSFGDRYYYLKPVLGAISELKREAITTAEFAEIAARAREKLHGNPDFRNTSGKYEGQIKGKYASDAKRADRNVELAEVYAAYQKALSDAHQYDYSDMIMSVLAALEQSRDGDGEFLAELQGAYNYFLVDEHQDTNDAQNRIIELIAERADGVAPNIFVVGDEKQAIFRFQGASLANFHYFQSRYDGVKLIVLRSNYRSTQAILDAAQAVSPRDVALIAHRKEPAGSSALLAVLSSLDMEYSFIAQMAGELTEGGVPAEEIAVLYRDNKDASAIAGAFEKRGIPVNIESDQDVLGDEDIRKFLRILRALNNFGKDWAVAEAMQVDFVGIPPLDAYKVTVFAHSRRRQIYDVIRSVAALEEAGVEAKEAVIKFSSHLAAWKRLAGNAGATVAFETVVRESGFLAHIVGHSMAPEKIAKLHALFDLLKSLVERHKDYSLEDFFSYLALIDAHGLSVRSADPVRVPGRVRLMTAHRAKGLEFDCVFVANAVENKWGVRRHNDPIVLPRAVYRAFRDVQNEEKDNDTDDSDERNVFYVALTRARKKLFVTMSMRDREGREQLPARFIEEINKGVLTRMDVTSYERDIAMHPEYFFAAPPRRTPALEDRKFLSALFDAQGLSVTAINNYLDCPWHYFYVNLVRIPEAPNKHLAFGNAVHASLKKYFDFFDAGNDHGKEYLCDRFEEALRGEPITETEFEETLEKGRRALSAFFDHYHAEWRPRGINEMRIDGVATSEADGEVKINGKLDRVEFLSENRVRVLDYKTGRYKSRNEIQGTTKTSDGNYLRQLIFYKLLLEKEGRYAMEEGVIQFIEPDERGNFRRETFSITADQVTELEAEVGRIAEEIRTLSFLDKGCNEKDCPYCALRRASLLE